MINQIGVRALIFGMCRGRLNRVWESGEDRREVEALATSSEDRWIQLLRLEKEEKDEK